MANLAFQITNDLCFAGVIVEDASVIEVQELVQARLNTDKRLRATIIHLARADDFVYPGAAWCAQIGNIICTDNPVAVTCLKCLAGYGNSIQESGYFPRG